MYQQGYQIREFTPRVNIWNIHSHLLIKCSMGYYELTKWPASSGRDSSADRAMDLYRRGDLSF